MKKTSVTLFISLFLSIALSGCNSSKPKVINSNNAHQQVNNTRSFPRASGEVICHNCRATFKIASHMQKQTHGHNYVECPVCHHDYQKQANK